MVLLGSKAPGRHVEQHDFFFGIARGLKQLAGDIKSFWPEAEGKVHIDAWREVTVVDGHRVSVRLKNESRSADADKKLFFINLGGYQENKFEEQHYTVLTVETNRAAALKKAKETLFFKKDHFDSHIDDKYGIDVDDLYEIEDILSPTDKERYRIDVLPSTGLQEDIIHLGYLKLNSLK